MSNCSFLDFYEIDKVTMNCSPIWNSTDAMPDTGGSNSSEIPLSRIVLITLLFAVVIVTILGNTIVLLAFKVIRRLTKVSNKFLVQTI